MTTMLRRTSASVIALLACTSLAAAADLNGPSYGGSLKDDLPAPAAAHNWAGFYVGLNGGYAWGDLDFNDIAFGFKKHYFTTVWETDKSLNFDLDGWFVGGQLGYNVQRGQFVFGVEIDAQIGDVGGSFEKEFGPMLISYSADVDSFGSVRARLGLARDQFLPYLTGGLAWANVDLDKSMSFGSHTKSAGDSNTHWGWVVGGGLEYALNQNLSIKGEYLYWDLGEEKYSLSWLDHCENTHTVSGDVDLSFHTVRIGFNYKFGDYSYAAPLK